MALNSNTSWLYLGLILAAYILLFVGYFKYQNRNAKMGGKISKPKTYWLGFAMFIYFVLPVWLYISSTSELIRQLCLTMIYLAYGRMIIQGLVMFILKRWTPTYGIAINILYISAMISWIGYSFIAMNTWTGKHLVFLFFAFQFAAVALVDSYYALVFHRQVGTATEGNQPIWFASADESFSRINQITYHWNIIFTLGFLIILVLLKISL